MIPQARPRRWPLEPKKRYAARVKRYRNAVRQELDRQAEWRRSFQPSKPTEARPGLEALSQAALSGLSGSARTSIESGTLVFNDGTTTVISPRERILIAAALTADRQERRDG